MKKISKSKVLFDGLPSLLLFIMTILLWLLHHEFSCLIIGGIGALVMWAIIVICDTITYNQNLNRDQAEAFKKTISRELKKTMDNFEQYGLSEEEIEQLSHEALEKVLSKKKNASN